MTAKHHGYFCYVDGGTFSYGMKIQHSNTRGITQHDSGYLRVDNKKDVGPVLVIMPDDDYYSGEISGKELIALRDLLIEVTK